jgi:membrane protein
MPSGESRVRVGRLRRWGRLLGTAAKRFSRDNLSDRAAALTYYAFLSLFPALIVAVSLLVLLGSYPETYRSIISTLRVAAPGTAVNTIDGALREALRDRGSAEGLLGIALVTAFWAASSGIAAAIRALNAIHGIPTGSRWFKRTGVRLLLTLVLMALFVIAFSAIVLAGPLFASIADAAGVDESVSGAVALLRWPIGAGALMAAILILYAVGSRRDARDSIELLPGAAAAACIWIVASVGLSAYAGHFSSYDATYGTLGAVIVLLVWIWLGNAALLFGALLNAERTSPPGGDRS